MNLKVKNKENDNLLTCACMKQKNFTRKQNDVSPFFLKRWMAGLCLLLLLLVAGGNHALAQSVQWVGGSPKLNPETLVMEGEAGMLELYFTAATDIPDAKVEIELPVGFKFVNYTPGSGTTAGVIFTGTSKEQKLTLTVTSNGGTLPTGSNLHALVEVTAGCGASLTGSEIAITVKSGEGVVTKGNQTLPVTVETPVISIKAKQETVNYNGVEDEKEFELDIQNNNGLVKNVKLELETETFVTLSLVTLDGVGVSLTEKTEGNTKTYSFSIPVLDKTLKTLKFKAKSARPGSRTIRPVAKYFLNTDCATEQQGQILTMVIPAATGKPDMKMLTVGYVDTNGNAVEPHQLNVNNSVNNIIRAVYQNDGDGDAYDLNPNLLMCFATYIDMENIYYQVGDGARMQLDEENMEVLIKVGSYSSYADFPANVKSLPRQISFHLPPDVIVKPKEKVTIWMENYSGEIYENGDKDYFLGSASVPLWVYFDFKFNVRDAQGDTFIAEGYQSGAFSMPMFTRIPESFVIKPSQSTTQRIDLYGGRVNQYNKFRLSLKLPEWMSLKYTDNWEEAIHLKHDSDTEFAPVAGSGKLDDGVYSLLFSSKDIGYSLIAEYSLSFDYAATGALDAEEESRKGQITYWIDYIHNGQELKNVSRVHQTVTLIPETGIRLDDFDFRRITKGLKDSNDRSIPDDGTIAPDSDVNPYLYMYEDIGEMNWKATILDGDYEYLYLPIKVSGGTIGVGDKYNVNLLKDQLSLKIGGVPIPKEEVAVLNEGGSYVYLRLEDQTNQYLKKDKEIKLSLRFKNCLSDKSISLVFSTECFVSHSAISKVSESFENPVRIGREKAQGNIRFIHMSTLLYWPRGATSVAFSHEGVSEKNAGIQAILYHNLPSPYFVKEVRRHAYPYKMTWELPEGYEFEEMVVDRGSLDKTGPASLVVPFTSEGNVYTFDFESLYDLEYDGSNTLKNGKWMLPDDRWSQNLKVKIKATKAAAASGLSKRTLIYKKHGTDKEYKATWDLDFQYLGTTITVEPSTKAVKAYTTRVNIPNIAVGNNSTDATLYNMWLYVTGNVKDLTLKGSGKTIQGEGFEGRWLRLGDVAGNTSVDYTLDFDFAGTDEEIKIYSVSGYDDENWKAPTDAKLATQLNDNLGGNTAIRITMADARLAGSIRVSEPLIEHLEPYTVTLTIDGTLSEGLLRNPAVDLIIPRGQAYVEGSARLTYENVTYDGGEVFGKLDGLFKAENDPVKPVQHTVKIDLKALFGKDILFPGFLSSDSKDTDAKRKAVITADFVPQCNSILTGMRYKGTISALDAAGAEAPVYEPNSPLMLPSVSADYTFNVTPQITRNAFNEWQQAAEWKVTIRKITGADMPLADEDYLLLELPAAMDIDGNVVRISSSDIAGIPSTATAEDLSEPESDKRYIKVALPVDAINKSGQYGQGKDLTFTIPVKFTGEATSPLHPIGATVVSTAVFGDCETSSEVGVGSATTRIALLPTAKTDYQVSVGQSVDLKIKANGLIGKWYAEEALSTELEEGANYEYSPVADDFQGKDLTNGVEVTFWVSALFANSDDPEQTDDYGKVPVKVTVYPSLSFDISYPMAICGSRSFNKTDLIKTASIPQGVTVTLYSDEECTSTINFPYEVNENHSVWAQAANKVFAGTPKEIEFTVWEPVEITSDLEEEILYIDFGKKSSLKVKTKGDNLAYTWYRGDVGGTVFTEISGAEEASFEVSETGEYYVIVEGCNQVQSKTATIIICPELTLAIDETMPVIYCVNNTALQDGIRLQDYLKDTNSDLTYLYKTGDGSYEEIKADVYLPKVAGETKYQIVSRNKAGSMSAPKELTIKIEQPLTITEHPANVTMRRGESTLLTVTAIGESLTYQWQKKNTGNVFENLAGAESDSYKVTEAGDYRVVVTGVTVGCGTEVLESDVATVTVRNPVQPVNETYMVTWEANWSGIVDLALYGFTDATIRSGEYVDKGTRLVVNARPGMAGLTLVKLTANGSEIMDGEVITISEDTHIVATFELGEVDPDPDPVGNATLQNEVKVWTTAGQLHIETGRQTEVVIYSLNGKLIAKRSVNGSESFHLPTGTYIIKAGDAVLKRIVE